jgi:hypothetical protein
MSKVVFTVKDKFKFTVPTKMVLTLLKDKTSKPINKFRYLNKSDLTAHQYQLAIRDDICLRRKPK